MGTPTKLKHPMGETAAFFQAVAGLVLIVLVTLGVAGTVYHFVAPDGMVAEIFNRSVAGGLAAIFTFLIVGVSLWMLRGWFRSSRRRQYPEVFVYAFAAAGLFYAFQLYMKGSL